MFGRQCVISQSESLGHEMMVHKSKSTGREEVHRNIEISGISSAVNEGSVGEAMTWDMMESGGEDSVLGSGERGRSMMLIRVVRASAY